jgi:polyisoprenoid-binding protein YceI
MNRYSRFPIASLFPIVMMLASQAMGASGHLEAAPESVVWLDGDSTFHPFTSRTTHFTASGTLDPQGLDAIHALKTFDVVIPVTSLKSKESALDKNMDKALKSDSCPDISFHLSNYVVAKDTSSTQAFHAEVNGTLSIACQEKPVTLDMNLLAGPGTVRVQGQYNLLMTDYGVKPPTMMMGAIKTKNSVVIHFDLSLTQAN